MLKKLYRVLLKLLTGFVVISIAWVLLYRFVPVIYTPLMAIRSISDSRHLPPQKHWTAINRISPHLITAVIAAEDQKFTSHHGFDIAAIKAALASNRKAQGNLKGASTISQQTAKNAFLWPGRDWLRKGLEAWLTVLIELLWSKQRIMEVYLNIIETGDGIYGAEASAQHYFRKSAAQLNRYEAASIAAILPSPRRWNARYPDNYTRKRIVWIQRQMYNLGTIKLKD